MKVTAAVVREQNVDFAVVLVKASAMRQSQAAKNELARSMGQLFPGFEIVLCAQDHQGRPEYWGRSDIVRFLSNIFFEQLPWADYRAAA